MLKTRVIPCLLLEDRGLIKTVRFDKPTYVGDPINAVRIFNEKEVDELIFLDISASKNGNEPNYSLISELSTECFMPFAYGGGITTLEQIRKILKLGVEKIVINKSALNGLNFIKEAVVEFGSSTIIVGVDVARNFFGQQRVYDHVRKRSTSKLPVEYAREVEQAGAGEIFVNNVDRDGTFLGFDVELVKSIVEKVAIPVIACGGASSLVDFKNVVHQGGASAVAAGSFFVFQGPHKAVLISYPKYDELDKFFSL